MHQSTTLSLSQTIWARWASRQFFTLPIVQTLVPVTFGYFLSSEAVVMRQLRRWKRLWQRPLICSHKRTSMGPLRSCWNDTSALQPEEITSRGLEFDVCTINKSVHTKKVWKLIVCTSYVACSSECIKQVCLFVFSIWTIVFIFVIFIMFWPRCPCALLNLRA